MPASRRFSPPVISPGRGIAGRARGLLVSPLPATDEGASEGVRRTSESTADALWSDVSARLRDALNDATYTTWFAQATARELDGEGFVVAVPNDFTRNWIEAHFRGLLEAMVRDSLGEDRPVRVVVREDKPPVQELRSPLPAPRSLDALNPK